MTQTISFDRVALDPEQFELRADGELVPVEPLVFDLILLLSSNPGRLLTRADLVQEIWDGRIVSDSTISTAIKQARKALGDNGEEQRFIRTVRGRGIQFASDIVTEVQSPATTDAAKRRQLALYIRAAHAANDAGVAQTATAIERRLRIILTRVPMLRIAARNASLEDNNDLPDLRASHGLTHVMDIRLQKEADRIWADAALNETANGFQFWAQSFDAPDVAGVSEVLLYKILARAEPVLFQAMIEEMRAHAGDDAPEALVLEALGQMALRGWNRTAFESALPLLDRAIAADPELPIAHATRAIIYSLGHRIGSFRDLPNSKEMAIESAERSLDLVHDDSLVLGVTGCALCDVGQLGRGMPIIKRAIEMNPANGHAHAAFGAALMMRENFAEAVEWLEKGIDISPADGRLSFWGAILALCRLRTGDVDGALKDAETACARDDRNYLPRLALAAIQLVRQNPDDAGVAVAEMLRTHPALIENEVLYIVGPELCAPIWSMVEGIRAAN